MAAAIVKPNAYDGAVCAPRLLATPDVSTEVARVTVGDQSNKPGVDSRWRLGLNSFRTRKAPFQRPPFDFAPEERDRLVPVHPCGRQVVRMLPGITSHSGYTEDRQAETNGQRDAVQERHRQRNHDGSGAGAVQAIAS